MLEKGNGEAQEEVQQGIDYAVEQALAFLDLAGKCQEIYENTLEEAQKKLSVKGLETLKKTFGKKARHIARQIDPALNNLSKSKERKALANLARERKLIPGKIGTIKKLGKGIKAVTSLLTAFSNIRKDGVSVDTVTSEVACRALELTLADNAIIIATSGLGLAGIEITVPFMVAFLGGHLVVSPIWDRIEASLKPQLREWIKQAKHYLWESSPAEDTYTATLITPDLVEQKTYQHFTALPEEERKELARAARQEFESEAKWQRKENIIQGQIKPTLNITFPPSVIQFIQESQSRKGDITPSFTPPEGSTKMHWGIIQDGRGNVALEGGITAPLNVTTDIHISAQLSGITSKEMQGMTVEAHVNHHAESINANLGVGVKAMIGAGGLAAIWLTGSIVFSEVAVVGAIGGGMGTGLGASLAISSSNPIAMAVGAGVLAVAGIGALIYKVIECAATKQLPFLYGNDECRELAKMLQHMQHELLTDTQRMRLIAQIDKCDHSDLTNDEGSAILHIMKYSLLYGTENFVEDWYKHSFEKSITLYNEDLKAGQQRVFQAIETDSIKIAREECASLLKKFPHEPYIKEIQKVLHDKDILQKQTYFLLKDKGLSSAENFFEEFLADDDISGEYEFNFAMIKHGLGYSSHAQKNARHIIERLSKKSSLSAEEVLIKEKAHYLSAVTETVKPLSEQSESYMLEQLNHVSPVLQTTLAAYISNEYDNKKNQIINEIEDIGKNTTLSEQEKESQINEKLPIVKSINLKQYAIVFDQYNKNPHQEGFYHKIIALALSLNNFDQLQSIITQEFLAIENLERELNQELSDAQIKRLLAAKEAIFTLADGDSGTRRQREYAQKIIGEFLVFKELSNVERSNCHDQMAKLMSRDIGSYYLKILEHRQESSKLDPKNVNKAIALADIYCLRLNYSAGKEVLKEICALSDDDKKNDIEKEIYGIELRSMRMQLLGVKIVFLGFSEFSKWLSQNKYINNDIARAAFYAHNISNFIKAGMVFYLHWKIRHTDKKLNSNEGETIANISSDFLHIASALSNLAIHNLPMLKNCEDDVWYQNFQKLNYGLDVTATGVSLFNAVYGLAQKPPPEKALQLRVNIFNTVSLIASAVDKYYLQNLREEGKAPVTCAGILGEATIGFFTSTPVLVASFAFSNRETIKELAEAAKTYDWVSFLEKFGYKSVADIPSVPIPLESLPKADLLPIGDISDNDAARVALLIGAAALVVACSILYILPQNEYNNCIQNAEKNIKLAKYHVDDSEKYLQIARENLAQILKSYPTDSKTLELIDKVSIYAIANNPEIKNKKEALALCDKYIFKNRKEESKDEKFRQIRLNLLIQKICSADLTEEERVLAFKQAQEDTENLINDNPRDSEAWWGKVILDEIKGDFAKALDSLKKMRSSVVNMTPKGLDGLTKKEEAILQKMQIIFEKIATSHQEGLGLVEQRLVARKGDFSPYTKKIQPDQIVWRNNEAFFSINDQWIKQEKKEPQPGDLVEKDSKFFEIEGDGPLRMIKHNAELLLQLTQVIQENLSPSLAMQWIEKVIEWQKTTTTLIYPPQKNKWMDSIKKQSETLLIKSQEQKDFFSKQYKQVLEGIENVKIALDKMFIEISQQGKDTAETFQEQLTESEREKLKATLAKQVKNFQDKIKSSLEIQIKKINDTGQKSLGYDDFKEVLEHGLLQIESQLALHVKRSENILWAKSFMEVVSCVTDLFQKAIQDMWTLEQYNHLNTKLVLLPDWSSSVKCTGENTSKQTQFFYQKTKNRGIRPQISAERPASIVSGSQESKSMSWFLNKPKTPTIAVTTTISTKSTLIQVSRPGFK